jgi:hypothetical protein
MKFHSKWNSYYQTTVLSQIAQAAVRKKIVDEKRFFKSEEKPIGYLKAIY